MLRTRRSITTMLTVTTALAILPATAGAAKETSSATGVREVCAKSTYVYKEAGRIFTGTLLNGQTIRVSRTSPSGKYSYGQARGHVNRRGWVKTGALCR